MKTPFPSLVSGLAVLATGLGSAFGAEAPITPEQHEFFEQKIRPVLAAECYECHNAKKHKGGLRLDYRAGWQKGGDSGETIIPGDPQKSLFMVSIRHDDPDLKMPDKSPKLDDKVIADFAKWIAMGAPDPRDEPPAEATGKPSWADLLATRRTWWAFQPVQKPAVPAVKNAAWSEHLVDRFLLAKMEEKNLSPAADADPRTLIRRLTFAITGLPPTPEEVETFATDSLRDRPSAIRNATDRLLASPHFGEHWARHWMDLMRYAESHGSEGDPSIPEAWRYRDYLIRAFNTDVPEDQLIREHLAGDLLPKPRLNPEGFNESILGTAQFRLVEHGFQPVDTLDDQVKAVDNQIDVVSKAFQGLTVSCARCHDHKFDAISQRDWTAMYGIFASCRPAQVTIDTPERLNKNRAALEQLHAQIKAGLADAWQAAAQDFPQRLQAALQPASPNPSLNTQRQAIEQQLADLDTAALRVIEPNRAPASNPPTVGPVPFAAWRFEGDGADAMGHLPGHLVGGAAIKDGHLVLNGSDAYFQTEALPVSLTAKTLEAWVAPANLDQRAGGIVTVERTTQHGFDSIVYAEREPRRWMAGSNFSVRTQPTGGSDETAPAGQWIHLAIVYNADGSIEVFRNGQPYGAKYTKGEMLPFSANEARVLIGLRHTGAKNGFFAGEIDEARLYDRALTEAEVAASFQRGPRPSIPLEKILAALAPEQRQERQRLTGELERLRASRPPENSPEEIRFNAVKNAASNINDPLHAWVRTGRAPAKAFATAWSKYLESFGDQIATANSPAPEGYRPLWDLTGDDYAKWFPYGSGLGNQPRAAGEFTIEAEGDRVLDGLMSAGAFTAVLSDKQNGVLTSPRFKIDSDSISIYAAGGGGAMARVIIDNYPLPSNPIFPKAILNNDKPGWVRLDTAYRKGSWAYLEFATRDDLTRPLDEAKKDKSKPKSPGNGRSFFSVGKIVAHDGGEPPREKSLALAPVTEGPAPQTADELAARYQAALFAAINAWKQNRLTDPQRAFLDGLVRSGMLPVTLDELPKVSPLVAEYRRLEAEVPVPQRVPGVLETVAYDAPFFPRGDFTKPGDPVPRGYLEVIDPQPYHTTLSGRLELAQDIAGAQNPLTARVMANRVWHWLFGRGLVPTVDNFGRLGEKATHPELLDHLATYLVEHGWSTKALIRYLVTSRAYAMSSTPSVPALETDPANEWLSHMRVRRLEAESIRDALLAASGELRDTMYGPSVDQNSPRRSIYLTVRRNGLNPFLQVFDAPKPFTTLGRRDVTNVPAQSLALLNSPFVSTQAGRWAKALVKDNAQTTDARIRRMFAVAFGRPPAEVELAGANDYLQTIAQDRDIPADRLLANEPVWQDFAQSLFNLKEFIYLR